jgi:hypothetical protein
MYRSTARALVQAIKAPVPTGGGGTLYVEGAPADKYDDKEFIRRMVARYALRMALEKGCTRIVVRHPTRAPIAFDVADVLLGNWREMGGHLPAPIGRPKVFTKLATVGFHALGAECGPTRPTFTVPQSFALTPVSGLDPGGKE